MAGLPADSRSHRLIHPLYVYAHAKLWSREPRIENHEFGNIFNDLRIGAIRLPKHFASAFCGPKDGLHFAVP